MDSLIVSMLTRLTSIICPLFVFVACSYYISKHVKIDSILLFISSGFSLLSTGFYTVLVPYLIEKRNLTFLDLSPYYTIGGIINFIFGLCFAIGLFILIYKTVNTNKLVSHQFPPSND